MLRVNPSPWRSFFFFLGIYLCSHLLLADVVGWTAASFGAGPEGRYLLVHENELFIQICSLFLALWLAPPRESRNLWAFVRSLWPRPFLPWESSLMKGWKAFLKAFAVTSAVVAVSLFLGLLRSELSPLPSSLASWLSGLPVWALEVGSWVLWILLIERSLSFFARSVAQSARDLEGRFFIVLFFGNLFYRLWNASPHFVDGILLGLVSALAAGTYLLWYETSLAASDAEGAALKRVCTLMGVFLGGLHVYGISFGGRRGVSVVSLFEGPFGESLSAAMNSGVATQLPVILALALVANSLLRKVLAERA